MSQIYENSKVNVVQLKENTPQRELTKCTDFEEAIDAAGFGKFNILLILIAFPSILCVQIEASAMSFVVPAAQCDLNLTLQDKGVLNAILYAGMISSCLICGSLVDYFGRRKILIATAFLDLIFILMSGFSTNMSMLLVAKFFSGAIMTGQSSGLMPYLSEFHSKKHRARVPLIVGLIYNVACIIVPLLAWLILSLDIKISLGGAVVLHAWNIFLLVSFIPGIISGIIYILMPETPKFLMSKGENQKAMDIFQKIYKFNTGLPKTEYPVCKLIDEKDNYLEKTNPLKEAWRQLLPIFSSVHAKNLILVCVLQTCLMMSTNTIRLWLPQIFQVMNDVSLTETNKSMSFCDVISTLQDIQVDKTETCTVNLDNTSVYTNYIIVSAVTIVGYGASACIINFFGKKKIIAVLAFTSSILVSSLYFVTSPAIVVVIICLYITCLSICVDTLIAIIIDLFPTTLRASAFSLCLMCGRIGVVSGNVLFPFLLNIGCAPPFFTLGVVTLCCAIFPILLPNTDMKSLE